MVKLIIHEFLKEIFQLRARTADIEDESLIFLHVGLILSLFAISAFEIFDFRIYLLSGLRVDDVQVRQLLRHHFGVEEFLGLFLILAKVDIEHIVVLP